MKKHDASIFCVHENLVKSGFNIQTEFPRINYEKYNGKKYRYFYAVSRSSADLSTDLIKVDIETKTTKMWSEVGYFPSEPTFVPRPGSTDEDDGVIVSAVLNENDENAGFLLILDAITFKEIARADFKTPSAIPTDFHGIFVSKMNG
jgi:carotenoid cleavage dioxygenase-like enzyme